MRTFIVILGIWLLINVLFVVIMMPPRKPRKPDHPRPSAGLAPATIERNGYPFDEDEKVSLRHAIIAIAMGALFSLTPPLLEAVDDIKRLIRKCRKPGRRSDAAETDQSRESILDELRARDTQTSAEGSAADERDRPKR